jgi:hypothetical protein
LPPVAPGTPPLDGAPPVRLIVPPLATGTPPLDGAPPVAGVPPEIAPPDELTDPPTGPAPPVFESSTSVAVEQATGIAASRAISGARLLRISSSKDE